MKNLLRRITPTTAIVGIACMASAMGQPPKAIAQETRPAVNPVPEAVIMFKNVNVFNGIDGELKNVDVLVVNNKIERIGKDLPTSGSYEIDAAEKVSREVAVNSHINANQYTVTINEKSGKTVKKTVAVQVVDGGGRTLMPGLIDSHVHLSLYTPFSVSRQTIDPWMSAVVGSERAQLMLMRGFTTVRDLGGASTYLTKAIDNGVIIGPRIYSANRMIAQTSGHGDMRAFLDPHPNLEGNKVTSYWEEYHTIIADGPDECLRAGRISLRNGAHFLKTFTSGGVTSEFDPLYMVQYTPSEIRAIRTASDQWKTYTTAHCFTDEGAKLAVENGVKCLEHVPMVSEETVKMLVDKGIFMELNVATILGRSLEELEAVMSPASFAKVKIAIEGQLKALESIAKYEDAKVVYGTDLVAPWGQPTLQAEDQLQLAEFGFYAKYFGNLRALRTATSTPGELCALTGPRNPYQEGKLGVIEEGAYADIILVDGNPLEDISIMSTDKNFHLVMKDGVIYKNEL